MSHWGDLNSRPPDYESGALPTKLQWRQRDHLRHRDKRIGAVDKAKFHRGQHDSMEETDEGAAPEGSTLSGTPNAAPTGDDGGAYGQPAVMVGPKSSLPKIMGILMMIYGTIMGLLSLLGILAIEDTISLYEEMGLEFNSIFLYVEGITAVGVNFVVAYAGNQVRNYQRSGVMMGLYAIGVQLAVSLIGTLLYADMMAEIAGDSGMGAIAGGIGAFFQVFCAAICGLLVALPILASADSLED